MTPKPADSWWNPEKWQLHMQVMSAGTAHTLVELHLIYKNRIIVKMSRPTWHELQEFQCIWMFKEKQWSSPLLGVQ
jgi:hypothetical protein